MELPQKVCYFLELYFVELDLYCHYKKGRPHYYYHNKTSCLDFYTKKQLLVEDEHHSYWRVW